MSDRLERKTITNIHYDCLERIFDYLDIENLLSCAGTCKRLQIAAAAKFADDFGKMPTKLFLNGKEWDSDWNGPGIYTYSDRIEITGFHFCLSFLRCFGSKVSNLSVHYVHISNAQSNYIDRYIDEYCSDTLTRIQLQTKNLLSSPQIFKKPFKNVEEVEVVVVKMGNLLPNFLNWFPKLNSMVLGNSEMGTALDVHFPYLKHLFLHISDNDGGFPGLKPLMFEGAVSLLHANRHLQSVHIDSWFAGITLTKLLNMISGNTSISELVVFSPGAIYTRNRQEIHEVHAVELTRFANEHASIVSLSLQMHRFTSVDAIAFIRQMNSLKLFKFQVKDRFECDRLLNQLDEEWKHDISNYFDEIQIKLTR